jgi:hypothetical protein
MYLMIQERKMNQMSLHVPPKVLALYLRCHRQQRLRLSDFIIDGSSSLKSEYGSQKRYCTMQGCSCALGGP